jgi:hypothetical protein
MVKSLTSGLPVSWVTHWHGCARGSSSAGSVKVRAACWRGTAPAAQKPRGTLLGRLGYLREWNKKEEGPMGNPQSTAKIAGHPRMEGLGNGLPPPRWHCRRRASNQRNHPGPRRLASSGRLLARA